MSLSPFMPECDAISANRHGHLDAVNRPNRSFPSPSS